LHSPISAIAQIHRKLSLCTGADHAHLREGFAIEWNTLEMENVSDAPAINFIT
jgi:hypothetical protein